MNKEYQYINTVAGNTVIPVPPVSYDDVLYLMREGVGIRLLNMFSEGDIEADIYSFGRLSQKTFSVSAPGIIFQQAVNISGGNYTRKYILLGTNPTSTSITYLISIKGVEARYEVQSGDSLQDVYAGIAAAINGATYPTGYTVSASSTLINYSITINSPTLINNFVLYSDNYKFETGYFAKINVLGQVYDYLISKSESNTDYPSLPSLSSSYAFSSLTKMLPGYGDYLTATESPNYITTRNLFTSLAGTATILSVPYIVENSSRAVLDEPNNRIIFSHKSPLLKNERINLLYK